MSVQFDLLAPPSVSTLQRTAPRALSLLTGIGKVPYLADAMRAQGFGEAEAAEGYALIQRATQPLPDATPSMPSAVSAALRTLSGEGLSFVRRVQALFARRSPALAREVFATVDVSGAPVLVVGAVLDRLDALRADARAEVVATMMLLEQRALGAEKRAELATLVRVATGQETLPVEGGPDGDARAAREAAQLALYRWYADWSETARAVARHRSDLIILGLARRRSSASEPPVEVADAPEPTALVALRAS
jgi:hypothetical protein